MKWFRFPSVRDVLAYESLSETGFGILPTLPAFRPNLYVDISAFRERKLDLMALYCGEMGTFPFPRSAEVMRAQAALHGSAAGCAAAEAFMLLKGIR